MPTSTLIRATGTTSRSPSSSALLTAAETSTYFIDAFEDNSTLLLLFLMPVMTVKFGMVAWYFMHLKSDSRLFSRLFISGIMLAVIVYMIFLLAFDEFF